MCTRSQQGKICRSSFVSSPIAIARVLGSMPSDSLRWKGCGGRETRAFLLNLSSFHSYQRLALFNFEFINVLLA